MSLTYKQKELMLFVQRYQHANSGVSPSFDEMRDELQLMSKSGVHRLINALEERGYLKRIPHRARAIEILRRVPDPNAKPITDDKRDELLAFATEVATATTMDAWAWRNKAQRLLEGVR